MNEGELHEYRSRLEAQVADLLAEWQRDNAMFWAEHPNISIQASPRSIISIGPWVGEISTFSEQERALRSIAAHVMDGRGFEWSVDNMAGGASYFWIGVYNDENNIRRDG